MNQNRSREPNSSLNLAPAGNVPAGLLISEAPKEVEAANGQFIRAVFTDERLAPLQIKKQDEISAAPTMAGVPLNKCFIK
ncbi:MAG: hypothetical protein LBU32_02760 [Clostridiales bacterium]|nr:hypothetical protein [Clostridiales bacterium]